MDFILEHNDDPIPDMSAQAPSSTHATGEPMDEDDDDAALLRAAYGGAADASATSSSAGGVEAKVSVISLIPTLCSLISPLCHTEHQVFRVR